MGTAVRASLEPAAASDKSGGGRGGSAGQVSLRAAPWEGATARGHFFHSVGRAFLVTNLIRLSSYVQRLVQEAFYFRRNDRGGLTPGAGAGGQTCGTRGVRSSSQPLRGPALFLASQGQVWGSG